MASKGKPYRTECIEGFEVLVGKGAQHNDYLSLDVAKPQDLWLHVADYAGSHVVIRNPDGLAEIPRAVIQGAATLAVHHSKARNARGKINVHYCWASQVSKRRGAPVGQVVLTRWKSISVYTA